MMYVTGDTHSDFSRFKMKNFPEQKEMDKNDYVVICGDFGGLWSGSKEENFWLDWLDGRPFTTLFVSGNHEIMTCWTPCRLRICLGEGCKG